MNTKIESDKINIACERYKRIYETKQQKFIKLDEWLDKESNIFEKELRKEKVNFPKFKRGEIIKVDFGINIGTELSHTHFAIVINSDDSTKNDNITVIPITSKDGYKRIFLGKILKKAIPNTKKYNLDCYGFLTQIKTISKKRVFATKERYICEDKILDKIDNEVITFLTKPK